MESGFFQPLDNRFKLAWIWWVILLSLQQIIFYEQNLSWNLFTGLFFAIIAVLFYFLIKQRRFFVNSHHLYFTRDFRLTMLDVDLTAISDVKLGNNRLQFSYAGKTYHFLIWGRSHRLLRQLLKENHVQYTPFNR